MNSPKNIVIIGGNAAGPAAAAKAKRTDPNANVTIIEAGKFISTGTCELPYVISGEIKNYSDIVFYDPDSFEKEKDVKVLINHNAEKIDRISKTITVRNLVSNQTFVQSYDKLILATGSRSKKLPGFAVMPKNAFKLKSVQDLIYIQEFLEKNKSLRILVIGSGYIGLETAEALKKSGFKVSMMEKEKLPMPDADEEIGHLILEILNSEGIEFYGGVRELKFIIKNEKVTAVNLEGRAVEFDAVIYSVGFEPNNDLAIGSKMEIGKFGGIKVNQKQQTSDPNIFAAGDNTEVINRITNRVEYMPLATYARQQGYTAGENAAGGNSYFYPVIKNIAVRIFNRSLVCVGLNSEEATANRFSINSVYAITPNLVKVMPGSENVFGKIIFEKSGNKILGACFLGGNEAVGYGDIISVFIHNKINGVELKNINYNYTPPLSPFVNLLSLLGSKIEKVKR